MTLTNTTRPPTSASYHGNQTTPSRSMSNSITTFWGPVRRSTRRQSTPTIATTILPTYFLDDLPLTHSVAAPIPALQDNQSIKTQEQLCHSQTSPTLLSTITKPHNKPSRSLTPNRTSQQVCPSCSHRDHACATVAIQQAHACIAHSSKAQKQHICNSPE